MNPEKDFYNYYQSVGGELENNKSYESCALRKTLDESGVCVEIKSLSFITIDKIYAIFVGYIGEQIPENKEPTKHADGQLENPNFEDPVLQY
ncbi:5364_t:CDS:2 [Paraglomus brasilianum]|uniref:5364_t:CDS:1 n=1 Tax=Paraglomus brasilianum TaxID=144538 RepID=A0A9N8VS85_9GLOM|nr:5364_t:CDS:2 [Paraglomus brasilianum]